MDRMDSQIRYTASERSWLTSMYASSVRIKKVDEHYEVFVNGKFYFSADNYNEVIKDLLSAGEVL